MEEAGANPLIPLLIDIFYVLFAAFSWPVLLALFLAKRKWREGFWERMGCVPRLPAHPKRIWVHAISVGEVEAARTFVPALAEAFPDADIVLSTTTLTGREIGRASCRERV